MEKLQRRFGAGIGVWFREAVAEEGRTRGSLARGLCEVADWRNAKGEFCLASGAADVRAWRSMMALRHPQGAPLSPGARLRYWIVSERRGRLGGIGFKAAGWHSKARDAFIGWSPRARTANLGRLVENDRFLILPGVRVRNLASRVLALAAERLPGDWEAAHGVRPLAACTHTGPGHSGACYRASGWSEELGRAPAKAIGWAPEPALADGAGWAEREYADHVSNVLQKAFTEVRSWQVHWFRKQPSLAGKDDTMTGMHSRSKLAEFKSELGSGGDAVRDLVRSMLQEILEEEMTEALGAAKSERTSDRLGYRSGYYKRHLTTRVGQVELRVPQDRNGAFSTELFECCERSEKAFVLALMQMQVHGVSTRKVAKVTEALCGHGFSASTISRLNAKLDAELGKFAERRLEGSFPYLILDARYEKVREDGVVRDRAVLIAVGVDAAGRRQVLGVELAEGESRASWRRFLESLRDRGLRGVVQVVSDDHSGLTKAIREVVPEAVRQRCYVHFLRNARTHLNRRSGEGCLRELRWIYDRPSVEEARRDLAAWLEKWQASQPKLCDWVEETIEETFACLRLPRQHHLRMRSTNMLERLNEEIKRRTKVVRIFPDARSCLRLVRALCAETHESWMEDGGRCLDMDLLQEQRRADLRKLAA